MYGAIGVLASVCGVAVLEGRKALQEDLNSLQRWAEAKWRRFPRAQCQILCWGHNSPCRAQGLGQRGWKEPWGCWARAAEQDPAGHNSLKGAWTKGGIGLFRHRTRNGMRENGHKLHQRKFRLDRGTISSLKGRGWQGRE